MKLFDKRGRHLRLTPPPRPADDAQPIGWVGGLAVWGEVNADWAHGQTRTGFVTPAERVAVWATGMENWDGHVWDVPDVKDVPLNWREIAAEDACWRAAVARDRQAVMDGLGDLVETDGRWQALRNPAAVLMAHLRRRVSRMASGRQDG